jgi:hypothetical protein
MHTNQRPVTESGQISLLLLLGAVQPQRHDTGEQMGADGENEPTIPATISDRFERYRTGQRIEAAAAVFLWYRQTLQTHIGAFAPQLP